MEKDTDITSWIIWKTLALALLGASGFLVQLWVGYVDQQLAHHVVRIYQHESQLALMEADAKRLREDHAKLEYQHYKLCQKTREC